MKNLILALLLLSISCKQTKETDPVIAAQSDYFSHVKSNDMLLSAPIQGEWRSEHKERKQTFQNYKSANPNRSIQEKNVIYLQPIGEFSVLQLEALKLTQVYLSIFFQRKTVINPTISDDIMPKTARRVRNEHTQLLAPYILDTLLMSKLPNDGIALMAITAKDLYPKEDWNYVFGLASYTKKVGVSSIYRLQNVILRSNNFNRCLERLINISSHEIGHMTGISHCVFAYCAMNGSNDLKETDASPNRLCSECQKKLFWNFRYDNNKRLKELITYFKANSLSRDYNLSMKDLK